MDDYVLLSGFAVTCFAIGFTISLKILAFKKFSEVLS